MNTSTRRSVSGRRRGWAFKPPGQSPQTDPPGRVSDRRPCSAKHPLGFIFMDTSMETSRPLRKLRDKGQVPWEDGRHGWRYSVAETGVWLEAPAFRTLVATAAAHRAANGLPALPLDDLAAQVEDQIAGRLDRLVQLDAKAT